MVLNTETDYTRITPEITSYASKCRSTSTIDTSLYGKYEVKRGLRDLDGKGVLTGLTEISEIKATTIENGVSVPCDGELYYRGYKVDELTAGFLGDKRFGFEETAYLLLFGELPTNSQLEEFKQTLAGYRTLPTSFVRDVIMKAPSSDMMNVLARCVLTLYAYDGKANDMSLENIVRQCLQLIAIFPLISVYGYQAYEHYHNGGSLFIHAPNKELSAAENILYMLRPDSTYTELEAKILDLALVLHAEHGGGNNSTFTTHVVASSGTDVYSVIAAALGSLKGPRHGGANIKVVQMFEDMTSVLGDWKDESEVAAYLERVLDKQAFDKAGLIYGMGHAIYSHSDPRARIFRQFVKSLSEEKGLEKEYRLYECVERLAPKIISARRKTYKGVSANIDFYSGFVYRMLNLPVELYTPIFAVARIAGWSAHLIEETINVGKIIRPAYMSIASRRDYVSMAERKEEA